MSNVEHAFENYIASYLEYKNDYEEEWKNKDINLKYLSEEEINAITECATYLIYTLFEGNKEYIRKVFHGDLS